jgi:iron complex transport system ATP-binding protein
MARALIRRPRLILLDEPTAGLDLLARERVLATVQALVSSRVAPTIVMITHHVEELPPATSHVLLLSEGRVAAAGAPGDVLTGGNLSKAYGVAVTVRSTGGRYYLEVDPAAWDQWLSRDR